MNRLPHLTLLAIAFILAITACNDDSCYDNGSSLPLAQCYINGGQMTLTGLTIKGIGVPGDSLLADSSALSEFYMPLRASVSSTSYMIQRQVIINSVPIKTVDTLTIDYDPIEYFHSTQCGAMFNFRVRHVTCTKHGIDSVTLLTPLITNAIVPALRIHFTDLNP